MQPSELTCVVLKVPPRDAVLRTHNRGVLAYQRLDLRRELRETVSLHAEENDVHGPSFLEIADHPWVNFKIAIRAEDSQAALLHRPQMRTARE